MLNEANIPLVLMMAEEFATYEMACRELKCPKDFIIKTKSGNEHRSPWIETRNLALKNYQSLASVFGLDPISSQKIGASKSIDKDPFEELIKKHNGE